MPTDRTDHDRTPAAPERHGATTAQLRGDIDRGATGDKVAGLDPAAAPLGADDEAAGVPASQEVVARARAQERGRASNSAGANAATPELQPDGRLKSRRDWAGPAAAGVLAAGGLGALLWIVLAI